MPYKRWASLDATGPQDTVNTFSWQLSLVQAELQTQWEAKCEHLLASAKDEHLQQYQEVCAQRDASQQKLLQLQEKVGVSPGAKQLSPVI